jgi:hypothetical protein
MTGREIGKEKCGRKGTSRSAARLHGLSGRAEIIFSEKVVFG